MRKFISVKDIVISAALLLLFLGILLLIRSGKGSCTAVITRDDTEIARIELSKAQEGRFSLPGAEDIIFEIKDKKIAFVSSDCPNKICIRSGFIGSQGETAVCLPNKTAVRIERSRASEG